jgi:DNA-binding SARP family transcriptional activator
MEFRLLGPVEVWAAGSPLCTGQPRQRAVLAALSVDAGRVVPWHVLADRVWGAAPPHDCRAALRAHVTRVRRVLERGAAGVPWSAPIAYRCGGYLLDVDRQRVDVHRFRHLLARSRVPDYADEQRLGFLREAVTLWRGEPLAGVSGQWAERVRRTWCGEHVDAIVAWARAELRVGDPSAVVGPVSDAVDDNPLVEPLTAVLMRALAAMGRVVDALQLYAATRRHLTDELGADPGAELVAAHRAVLRGEDPGDAASNRIVAQSGGAALWSLQSQTDRGGAVSSWHRRNRPTTPTERLATRSCETSSSSGCCTARRCGSCSRHSPSDWA